MVKNWCIYIVLLIGIVTFFLFYQMWLAWYCLVVVLLIPPIALISCILNSMFTTLKLDVPKNIKMGDNTGLLLIAETPSIFSFSICRVTVTSTEVMTERVSKKRKVEIDSRGKKEIPIDTTHCGAFVYNIKKVRMYDLFKLFFIPKRITFSQEVLVRPLPVIPEVLPDSNGFKARMLKKSSQSYSEIYDVRDYVVGDPIKNIHWKLSAKRDKILVKEPQEHCYGHARIYLELKNDREQMDRKLGELLFTSNYFLEHDIDHKIRVLPPMKREVAFDIESQRDLDTAIIKILHMKIPKETEDAK